jgi:hypothetical protein
VSLPDRSFDAVVCAGGIVAETPGQILRELRNAVGYKGASEFVFEAIHTKWYEDTQYKLERDDIQFTRYHMETLINEGVIKETDVDSEGRNWCERFRTAMAFMATPKGQDYKRRRREWRRNPPPVIPPVMPPIDIGKGLTITSIIPKPVDPSTMGKPKYAYSFDTVDLAGMPARMVVSVYQP